MGQPSGSGALASFELVSDSLSIFQKLLDCQLTCHSPTDSVKRIHQLGNDYGDLLKHYSTDLEAVELRISEMLFELASISFMHGACGGGNLLVRLLDWMRSNFGKGDELLSSLKDSQRISETSSDYWDCLFALILEGRIDAARSLLSFHSAAATSLFENFDKTLGQMPKLKDCHSSAQYEARLVMWQDGLSRRILNRLPKNMPELSLCIKLLCGKVEAFSNPRILQLLGTWYNVLFPLVFYSRPSNGRRELADKVEQCVALFDRRGHEFSLVDRSVRACIELNVNGLMHSLSQLCSSWWLPATLCDLLWRYTKTKTDSAVFVNEEVRDELVIKYGNSVAEAYGLEMASAYFETCGKQGMAIIRGRLEKAVLSDDRAVYKAVAHARRLGLSDIESLLLVRRSKRLAEMGDVCNALFSAIRAKDFVLAEEHALTCFTGHLTAKDETNILEDLISVGVLEPTDEFGPYLMALTAFLQLHCYGRHGRTKDAAELLCQLLCDGACDHSAVRAAVVRSAVPFLKRLLASNEDDAFSAADLAVVSRRLREDDLDDVGLGIDRPSLSRLLNELMFGAVVTSVK